MSGMFNTWLLFRIIMKFVAVLIIQQERSKWFVIKSNSLSQLASFQRFIVKLWLELVLSQRFTIELKELIDVLGYSEV